LLIGAPPVARAGVPPDPELIGDPPRPDPPLPPTGLGVPASEFVSDVELQLAIAIIIAQPQTRARLRRIDCMVSIDTIPVAAVPCCTYYDHVPHTATRNMCIPAIHKNRPVIKSL
jgi:hypothetical protein